MRRLRALLANEAGGGRGHVTTLRAAALALGPEVSLVAALARDTYADELRGLCESVVKAPVLSRPREVEARLGFRGCATWADGLATLGLADAGKLRRGLQYWRDLIVSEDISLLIADHAPLALWAARGLRDEGWGIRVVNVGIGYTVPPADLTEFPAFLPDFDRTLHSEAETLALMNRVGEEMGLDPLPRLAALYATDLSLATSFAFLDPYLGQRDPASRIPPLVAMANQLAGVGDEVFVYFSTTELRDDALVEALAQLPLPRRGFLPSAPPDASARLSASGMVLLNAPASANEIAACARLIVHAAPHGTVCLAALAGLPQFGVPQHQEQLFNARAAAALGILTHAPPGSPDFAERIAAAYADQAMRDRAQEVAHELRKDHPDDLLGLLAARLATEVAAARAAPW